MLAAVLKDKQKLSVEEVSLTSLRGNEVRVKVKYCGICGSDLTRYVRGEYPGLILGHEVSGIIEETGKEVKTWKRGDRVVINPLPFCGQCFQCRSGATNLCAEGLTGIGLEMPGAFAQYCTVPSGMLCSLPPQMDFASGALVEPAAVILHAIRRSKISIGDSAVILGAGPLGLFTVKFLKNMGIIPVVVIEPDRPRARLATDFGADHVFTKEIDRPFLQNLWGIKGGCDVVFECSGTAPAVNLALELVHPAGTVVLVGVSKAPLEVYLRSVVTKEINILGTLGSTTEFQQAIQFLERGVISPKELLTEIVPLKDIDLVFRRCLGQEKPLKVLIDPNENQGPAAKS